MANMHSTPANSIFNRLTYLKPRDADLSSNGYALFRCACGNEKYIKSKLVFSGSVKSCGCLRDETARKLLLTHGHSQSKKGSAYGSWENMLQRCNNPKSTGYTVYGGRGISVCFRWLSFENFLEDMGPRPSTNHSIDRIDNDGNYEPANCRWATSGEQASNNSRNHAIQFKGEILNIAQLSLKTGVAYNSLRYRIRSGLPLEEVVSNADLNCRMIEHCGISLSMTGWERKLGLSRGVIETRLRRGKSVEDALAPVKPQHRKK